MQVRGHECEQTQTPSDVSNGAQEGKIEPRTFKVMDLCRTWDKGGEGDN